MKRILLIALSLTLAVSLSGCSQEKTSKTGDREKEDLMTEEDYNLLVEEGEIKGSLLVAKGQEVDTVAIIIAGSGPTDRNGNNPLGGENNSLKMLAHSLGKEGIASIRYDKRGVGESQSLVEKEEDLTFENYIQDVNSWVDKLTEDKRFKNIIIVGHSEGALIGAVSAAEKDIKAFISIAGVGEGAADTLRRQLKAQGQEVYQESAPILENLEKGIMTEDTPKELESLFRLSVQPYLISWFKYDPSVVISKITCPVLIIQGNNDLQVTVDDAAKLHAGNPESKLVIIDNMNHILKDAPQDRDGNIAAYNNPYLPINNELIEEIVAFIREAVS